jgi:hypothetical protein
VRSASCFRMVAAIGIGEDKEHSLLTTAPHELCDRLALCHAYILASYCESATTRLADRPMLWRWLIVGCPKPSELARGGRREEIRHLSGRDWAFGEEDWWGFWHAFFLFSSYQFSYWHHLTCGTTGHIAMLDWTSGLTG